MVRSTSGSRRPSIGRVSRLRASQISRPRRIRDRASSEGLGARPYRKRTRSARRWSSAAFQSLRTRPSSSSSACLGVSKAGQRPARARPRLRRGRPRRIAGARGYAAVPQRGLDVVDALAVGAREQGRRRQRRGRRCQEDRVARQRRRPAATPLAPALGEAAVRDAAQRQVVEVPPQVGGQGRRVGVALAGVGTEALADDVREAHGDLRVEPRRAAPAVPAGLGRRPAERLVEQQAERVDVGAAVDRDTDRPGPARRRPSPRAARARRSRASRRASRAAARSGSIGARARWKSRSIGWPSPASRTFDGLTSMWTRPRSWAYCRRVGQAAADPADRLRRTSPARGTAPEGPLAGERDRRQEPAGSGRAPRAGALPVGGRAGPRPAARGSAPGSRRRGRACRGPGGPGPGAPARR